MTVQDLYDKVQMLSSELTHHLAQQSNAHDIARENNEGFMSREHVRALQESKGERAFIESSALTDVFDLSEGKWCVNVTGQLLNMPTNESGVWLIDVNVSPQKRKDFTCTHSWTGVQYHRTLHTNANAEASKGVWLRYGDILTTTYQPAFLTEGEIIINCAEFGSHRIVTFILRRAKKDVASNETILTLPAHLVPNYSIDEYLYPFENRFESNMYGFLSIDANNGNVYMSVAPEAVGKTIYKTITYIVNRKL